MVYPVEQSKVGWLLLKLSLKPQRAVCSCSRRTEISVHPIDAARAARQRQLSYEIGAQLGSLLSTIKLTKYSQTLNC